MTAFEWVPAPVHSCYGEGRRWKLLRGGREVGRVVQLLSRGRWEASSDLSGVHFHSPGHETIGGARQALLEFVERNLSKGARE